MPITVDIRRDEVGDMVGKLCLRVYASDVVVHTCYVRDLNQASLELCTFIKENFEDDGADICWKVK